MVKQFELRMKESVLDLAWNALRGSFNLKATSFLFYCIQLEIIVTISFVWTMNGFDRHSITALLSLSTDHNNHPGQGG